MQRGERESETHKRRAKWKRMKLNFGLSLADQLLWFPFFLLELKGAQFDSIEIGSPLIFYRLFFCSFTIVEWPS